jgi:hypothetical protein
MEIEDSAVPKNEEPGRRSMRVKRARQLAIEEEETANKRRQVYLFSFFLSFQSFTPTLSLFHGFFPEGQ